MLFPVLILPFKKYLLYERGLTPKQYKAVIAAMQGLCTHATEERLSKLTTDRIRSYLLETSRQRAWSPKTFRNQRQCLKTYFDWACHAQLIKTNPVDAIEKPRLPKRLPRFLTRQEVESIVTHTAWHSWQSERVGKRNQAIIATFVFTGLRLRELLNLTLADVDLKNGSILVRQGKGRKDRIVPIHRRLFPALNAYLSLHPSHDPLRPFFTGARSSKGLYPKDIQRICQLVSLNSGIKFTPHMLRHTFGRLAIEGDLNIYKLKEIMGHADISTTQIYLSVSTEKLKESFDRVELL